MVISPYVTRTWCRTLPGAHAQRVPAGEYQAFIPEPLTTKTVNLARATRQRVERAEQSARSLEPVSRGVNALLTLGEACASSHIEGYTPHLASVAVGDFLGRAKPAVAAVVRNVRAVRWAANAPASPATVLEMTDQAHTMITPYAQGLRDQQVWIGGSSPMSAWFVPAPAEHVAELMGDLGAYITSRAHSPVLAAALAHAQYETIHPHIDGNGRAGRLLTALVLSTYGLAPGIVLPVSVELARARHDYFEALDAYRDGHIEPIVDLVAEAVAQACVDVLETERELEVLAREDHATYQGYARMQAPTGRLRRGVGDKVIDMLAERPVWSTTRAAETFNLSHEGARKALNALARAGVLRRDVAYDAQRAVYVADRALSLVKATVRQPWDGYGDEPLVNVDGTPTPHGQCGAWLPRAGRACALPAGHGSQHR